jgi:SAM-dependent methyltransferase
LADYIPRSTFSALGMAAIRPQPSRNGSISTRRTAWYGTNMRSSLYGQPAIHDLLHFGWSADLAHYEALATEVRTRCDAPILEGAVGSGRVALHLARAGHVVHGIDRDKAMLAALAERISAEPAHVRERLSFAEGDLRALPDGPRGLVFAALNSIGLLHEPDDLAAFFSSAARVLVPGGRLAFDIWRPDPTTLAQARTPTGSVVESPRFRDPRDDTWVRCSETTWIDEHTGLLHVDLDIHRLDESAPEQLSLAIRLWDADTLVALARRCELVVQERVELGEVQGWILRPR